MIKIKSILSIAAISGLLLSTANGTVHFQNTGINAGWNGNSTSGGGTKTVTEVTNVKYKGSKALRFILKYPGYRVEKNKSANANLGQRGNTRFYGFALRLPSNWQNMNDRDVYFCQNIAKYTNCNPDNFKPSFFFGARGGNFKIIRSYQGSPCGNVTGTSVNVNGIIKNSWVKVIYRATWKSGNDGRIEVWINGTRKHNFTGKTTYAFTQPMQFKAGMYIPGWKNSQGSSTQSEKKAWIDHWRIATTKNEADPTKW